MKDTYKDPKRKIGSQSETPIIKYKDDKIIIEGYQQFIIDKKTKNIQYGSKKDKFNYINELMKLLNSEYKCKTIIDIGCSSGLTSLIAYNNNFENILSLDHDPEYIDTLKTIKNHCNITKINELVYSFGDSIIGKYPFCQCKFDVVFCGAIIHWIFSLTADFRNFDSIMSYLISLTNNILIIEWIDPKDSAISNLHHITLRKLNNDQPYNTENFEIAIKKFSTIIYKKKSDGPYRIIYTLLINQK